MANTLFLRLEGPMQSWGERARWSVRDTADAPTKSGIVGLLACALGWNTDPDLRNLSQQIRLGVRCDRPGTPLIDFHTVVGGVMSAEGKVKKNANTGKAETVVSWRHYLCDASFLAAVQADDSGLITRLAEAIQSPRWPVFLGRKSCPPGLPPYAGVGDYPGLIEALQSTPLNTPQKQDPLQVRAVIECRPGEGVRRREEIDSRSFRTFLPRYTMEVSLTVKVLQEA